MTSLEPGSLASFVGFLWRHKLLIGLLTGLATAAAVVYVLVVPVQYTASATLLPQSEGLPGLLSVAASLAGGSGLPIAGLSGLATPEQAIQEGILRSERLADLIETEFAIGERYKTRNREERLRVWQSRLGTGTNQQGLLSVGYRDRDPEFATRVVERLIEHLDRFNREVRTTSSRRKREFVEKRLVEARSRLASVESELVAYQAEHQTLALSPTTEAVVIAGADIISQRLRLEMEVQMLLESLSPEAPAVRTKRAEIDALDRELGRLPELGSELARLLRDMRVRENTYGFLSAQLEEARIDEARDTPTVDVLDPPVVPTEKSWPPRKLTVLAVLFVSGLFSMLLAKLLDALGTVRRAEAAGRGS